MGYGNGGPPYYNTYGGGGGYHHPPPPPLPHLMGETDPRYASNGNPYLGGEGQQIQQQQQPDSPSLAVQQPRQPPRNPQQARTNYATLGNNRPYSPNANGTRPAGKVVSYRNIHSSKTVPSSKISKHDNTYFNKLQLQ